jgi:hypothetical protein
VRLDPTVPASAIYCQVSRGPGTLDYLGIAQLAQFHWFTSVSEVANCRSGEMRSICWKGSTELIVSESRVRRGYVGP